MGGILFSKPLYRGILQKRYKRFLADVVADNGEILTLHCPNTGAMTGLTEPGTVVWFSGADHEVLFVHDPKDSPRGNRKSLRELLTASVQDYSHSSGDFLASSQGKKDERNFPLTPYDAMGYKDFFLSEDVGLKKTKTTRRYEYTWQMIQQGSLFIGVNTQNPNRLVRRALLQQELPMFQHYDKITPEYAYGSHRFDFYGQNPQGERCFIEVKNVHWRRPDLERREQGYERFPWAYFPDTITERGRRHVEALESLGSLHPEEQKVALFYVVQRHDCLGVQASREADEDYWQTLQQAFHVDIYGYNCLLSPLGIMLDQQLLAPSAKNNSPSEES